MGAQCCTQGSRSLESNAGSNNCVIVFQSDMKYLSPLLLAYEDRMAEKDALLQAVKVRGRGRVCV